MKDRQKKSALAIFEVFAEVCPLKIRPASIVNRDPPEPDVLCAVGDGKEQVAFELVQIIDEGWGSLTSAQLRDTASLRDAYSLSTGNQRAALDERLGNALVYVSFCRSIPARRRRLAVSQILQYLASIKPDFSGDWNPPAGDSLHGAVRAIRITRGSFPGPEFDVEAVSAIGDPTVDRIRAKWAKSYSSPHPIELLAFYERQPQAPDILWLPALESFVQDSWDRSPFRRVWLLDVGSRTISAVLSSARTDEQAITRMEPTAAPNAGAPRLIRKR